MDLSSPNPTTNSPLIPVFGDNVQDLLGRSALNVNPSAIITVNSIADTVDDLNSGVTTLRDAINQANADTGSDLILFDRSLFSTAQTITLNLGELDITHNLSIIAPRDSLTGGDLLTVSGNKTSRVFEVETGAQVNLSGLIIADGKVQDDNGGGIKNSGILTLDNSIVRNNSAFSTTTFSIVDESTSNKGTSFGGGIYNTGTLTLSDSTISSNTVNYNGGGIYNTGNLTVSNSTINSNSAFNDFFVTSGVGIYNTGNLTVSNSTINRNSASSLGATSGGGIYNTGYLTVSNSTISGNNLISGGSTNGGGIYNSDSGIVTLSHSTLSGNRVSQFNTGAYTGKGGGIYNSGTLMVRNSTLVNNYVGGFPGNGGGIYNSKTLTLVFSTVTLNQAFNGGGVFNTNYGTANLRNTIIAGNFLTSGLLIGRTNPDATGNFSSNGYNLIGNSTGNTGFDATGDIVGTSDNPIDPRLAPLDFNGGSTQTLALLPDSPAIDAADPTVLDTDPTTDQRGLPRVSGDRADIGAFEFSRGVPDLE